MNSPIHLSRNIRSSYQVYYKTTNVQIMSKNWSFSGRNPTLYLKAYYKRHKSKVKHLNPLKRVKVKTEFSRSGSHSNVSSVLRLCVGVCKLPERSCASGVVLIFIFTCSCKAISKLPENCGDITAHSVAQLSALCVLVIRDE